MSDLEATLQGYMDRLVRETGLPGAAAAILFEECVVTANAGYAQLEDAVPVTAQSRFGVCCMGRMLTSLMVLQLVEQGVLDLNTPIADYLSELRSEKRPKAKHIKLHHLLSHTAGFIAPEMSHQDSDWDHIVENFHGADMLFRPGRVFNEQNCDYALVGEIVRRATDQSVLALIEKEVYAPVGIRAGNSEQDLRDPGAFVHGYRIARDAPGPKCVEVKTTNYLWEPGVSNATLTTPDLLQLGAAAFLDPEREGVFSPSLRRQFQTPLVGLRRTLCAHPFPGWIVSAFGMGFARFRNGRTGFFARGRRHASAIIHDPASGAVVALALNMSRSAVRTAAIHGIFELISGNAASGPIVPETMAVNDVAFDDILAGFKPRDLAGRYQGGGSNLILTVEATPTRIKLSGDNHLAVVGALQRDRLLVESKSPLSLAFFRDQSGKPAIMMGMGAYKKIA